MTGASSSCPWNTSLLGNCNPTLPALTQHLQSERSRNQSQFLADSQPSAAPCAQQDLSCPTQQLSELSLHFPFYYIKCFPNEDCGQEERRKKGKLHQLHAKEVFPRLNYVFSLIALFTCQSWKQHIPWKAFTPGRKTARIQLNSDWACFLLNLPWTNTRQPEPCPDLLHHPSGPPPAPNMRKVHTLRKQ